MFGLILASASIIHKMCALPLEEKAVSCVVELEEKGPDSLHAVWKFVRSLLWCVLCKT